MPLGRGRCVARYTEVERRGRAGLGRPSSGFLAMLGLSGCVILCRTEQRLTMYVCMVITYSKGKDQPGKVANPARGQLIREN